MNGGRGFGLHLNRKVAHSTCGGINIVGGNDAHQEATIYINRNILIMTNGDKIKKTTRSHRGMVAVEGDGKRVAVGKFHLDLGLAGKPRKLSLNFCGWLVGGNDS